LKRLSPSKLDNHRYFSAAKPTPTHPHPTSTPGLRCQDHLRRERANLDSHSAFTTSWCENGPATVCGLGRISRNGLDNHRYFSAAKPTPTHPHPTSTPGLRCQDHLRRERANLSSHSALTTSWCENGPATVCGQERISRNGLDSRLYLSAAKPTPTRPHSTPTGGPQRQDHFQGSGVLAIRSAPATRSNAPVRRASAGDAAPAPTSTARGSFRSPARGRFRNAKRCSTTTSRQSFTSRTSAPRRHLRHIAKRFDNIRFSCGPPPKG
jgi:hypothetical protein